MKTLETISLNQLIAGIIIVISLWYIIVRPHQLRISALLFVTALTLFANNPYCFAIGIFVVATAVTEVEFLQNIAAILSKAKPYFDWKTATAGIANPSEIPTKTGRSKMEYKILNTLWTKQVNKFPDFKVFFTFRINANSIEFLPFREAGNQLIGQGLITETDQGQFCLTPQGWDYCKKHYGEFAPEQWWPEETLDQKNLKRVLES